MSGELLPTINNRNSTSYNLRNFDDTGRFRKSSQAQPSPTMRPATPKKGSLSPTLSSSFRERLEPLDYSQWTQSIRTKGRKSESDLKVNIPCSDCDTPSSFSAASSPCIQPSSSQRRPISPLGAARKSVKILESLLHRSRLWYALPFTKLPLPPLH